MGKLIRKPIEVVLVQISKIFSIILPISFIFVSSILCQETKIYNSGNSPLLVEKLTCLSVDSANGIWIGTNGGVFHLIKNSWTKLDTLFGSDYPNVVDIKTAPNGNVWFSIIGGLYQDTTLKQISYFDQSKINTFQFHLSLLGFDPGKLFIDTDNSVYLSLWPTWQQGIGSEINSIGIIKNSNLKITTPNTNPEIAGIDYVIHMNGDSLFCCDWEGIHLYDGENFHLFNPVGWIPKGCAKRNKAVYVFGKGFEQYSLNSYQSFQQIDSVLAVDSLVVTCVDVDLNNAFWLGTDRGYLIKYSISKIDKIKLGPNKIIDIGIDKDGNKWLIMEAIGCFEYNEDHIVSVKQKPDLAIPRNIILKQNYPNPFNPSTRIAFNLPKREFVTLKIFDILGRQLAVLANNSYEAGNYELEFDASNLPSGVYLYSLITDKNSIVKKMILLK